MPTGFHALELAIVIGLIFAALVWHWRARSHPSPEPLSSRGAMGGQREPFHLVGNRSRPLDSPNPSRRADTRRGVTSDATSWQY